jgi:primase-polymerase (primpol)-like protein
MEMKDIKIELTMSKEDDKKYSNFIQNSIKLLNLKEKRNNLEAKLENLLLQIELLEAECFNMFDNDNLL